jgi:hypothetical protein
MKLISLYESSNFYIGYIKAKNYWTEKGKKIYFTISRTMLPSSPNFTGFCIIIGTLNLGIFWKKFSII